MEGRKKEQVGSRTSEFSGQLYMFCLFVFFFAVSGPP